MQKNNTVIRLFFYIIGFLIMTLGIAVSVKSDLGVSPVSSIPYTMTCVWGIEMGMATIIFHILLVLIQIILLRRSFELKNLLQIPVGVLFGLFTTMCNKLMNIFPSPKDLQIKLIMMFISTFFIALGIFFYVPADFVPLAGEGTMLAVSKVTKIKFSTVKIFFDISMVVISFAVCTAVIHSPGSVGAGTVIAAVLVGTELKLITKAFGNARDRVLHSNKSVKLSNKPVEDPAAGGIITDNATAAAGTEDLTVSPLYQIMKKDVYTLNTKDTLFDALKFMTEKKISGAPVIEDSGKLYGFISDGDILRFLSSEHPLFVNPDSIEKISFNDKLSDLMKHKVSEIASRRIFSVDASDDLGEVCYKLTENHLKKAPVLENGRMIGMINSSNITKYAVKIMEG